MWQIKSEAQEASKVLKNKKQKFGFCSQTEISENQQSYYCRDRIVYCSIML